MNSGVSQNETRHTEGCRKCGSKTHPDQTAGLCPRCVLVAAVSCITADDHPALGTMAVNGRCPTVDSLNREFPDFEFQQLLGRGGSGWTFLATQKNLSRPVAVKLMRKAGSTTPDSIERFQREAGILARLNHSNIVTVHDFGSTDRFLYIVMEYVPGATLRSRITTGNVDSSEVIAIGRQMCSALEFAHERGLIHRDIKPENILVVSSEPVTEIRVADFGISRGVVDHESINGLTATGLIVGTPFYMAPEQQVPGRNIDHRADIYSTGVVLYELLTGRLPQGNFPPPSRLSNCSAAMNTAVMKALENDPDRRHNSIAEFGSRLTDAAAVAQNGAGSRALVFVLVVVFLVALIGVAVVSSGMSGDSAAQNNADLADTGTGNSTADGDDVGTDSSGENQPVPDVAASDNSVDGHGGDSNVSREAPANAGPFDVSPNAGADNGSVPSAGQPQPEVIPRGYRSLLNQLESNSTFTVREALTTLADVPPEPELQAVNDAVRKAIDHSDQWVQREALSTIVAIDPDGCADDLLRALDFDFMLRNHAMGLLAEVRDPDAVKGLAAHMGGTDHQWIVDALVRFGSAAEPELIEFLKGESAWMYKLPVAKALGAVGTELSIEPLEQAQRGSNSHVADAASLSLRRIHERIERESEEEEDQ